MNTKTYRGKTAKEVLARVSRELGPDAEIVDRKLIKGKDGDTFIEVIAAPRTSTVVDLKAVPETGRSIPKYKALLAGIGGIIVVIILLIVAVTVFRGGEEAVQIQPVNTEQVSIAVLAFTDLSPDKDQEWFCAGLSDDLINKLTRVDGLNVISRSSSFYFKGKDVDISEIGRQLGVSAILEGSVRKSGTRLKINTQLIDVSDNSIIWSESYDRELRDIFDIQEEVALAVVDSLKLELGVEEQKRLGERYETSPEVYELYLRGRFISNPKTLERLEMAIELFDRAITKDPSFAPAYARKALCYIGLTMRFAGDYPLESTFQMAISAIAKAVELNPDLVDVHLALATIKTMYEWDWQGAEHELKRALELAPGRSDVHAAYGGHLILMGRFDKGISERERAVELDPLSIDTRMNLGHAYLSSGRVKEAIKQYHNAHDMSPKYWFPISWLAAGYAEMGEEEIALAWLNKLETFTEFQESPILQFCEAVVYAKLGRREESRKHLDQLLKFAGTTYVYPSAIAGVYALLGENDEAFEWLDRSIEERDPHGILGVTSQFWWGELKSDPRFDEFLKGVGLPIKR